MTVESVMPDDIIKLANFNESFFLANETYTFELRPIYLVPRTVKRHIIYTSSTASTKRAIKRAIMSNLAELNELSEEDYTILSQYMDGDVPYLTVNSKKRSLPLIEGSLRVVPIAKKVSFITSVGSDFETKKRGVNEELQTVQDQQTCVHIPFFTTCDNSVDIQKVKTGLQAAVDSLHYEIDSYIKTDNQRANGRTDVLNKQRDIIDQLANENAVLGNVIATIAGSVQVNAAQCADGDFQAHAQVNYLKRTTNALLKYSNALASTDPRALVAQPALTQLFRGYLTAMDQLRTNKSEPIVDTSPTTAFNWTEMLLPSQSVQNVTNPPCLTQVGAGKCASDPTKLHRTAQVPVFKAVFSYTCLTSPPTYGYPPGGVESCVAPAVLQWETSVENYIYGPFHKMHFGIYNVVVPTSPTTSVTVQQMQPIVQGKGTITYVRKYNPATEPAYCVQFMGYKMFSSVQDPSSTLINSYAPPLPAVTDCDVMRLVDGSEPTPKVLTTIYSLYADTEGVIIPFYSNCDIKPLTDAIYAASPSNTLVSTINYVCSNAWFAGGFNLCNTSVPRSVASSDVFSRHWISSTCYINLEPGWLDLDYYVAPPLAVIPFVPRGYILTQFTINLDGELSSSIEFVYTDQWLPVYTVARTSTNTIIADEIRALEGSKVLFYIDGSLVIDESDSFFGKGINGRDCIQKSDTYEYNLINCFFQNDNNMYTPNDYLNGIITTTGISRYNRKFDFVVYDDTDPYTFTLTPKSSSDYSYFVQLNETVCPKLLNQQTGNSQCIISLLYSGTKQVVLTSSNSTDIPIVPIWNGTVSNFPVGLSSWIVTVGGTKCYVLHCHQTATVSTVTLDFPDVEIISQSDLALQTKIDLSISKTINDTITKMRNTQESAGIIIDNIQQLREQLASINFNVSDIIPFQNFTDLRKDVDDLINALGDDTPQDTKCEGPWNSVVCFFQDFASTLIIVAVVLVVVVIGFIIFKKRKSIFKRRGHHSVEEHELKNMPEFRANS